ncbi:hypothetical protein [Modicisalibacter luteus]
MVSDTIQISHHWTAITVPLTGAIFLLHLVYGFDLLEHFSDENALIDEALDDPGIDDSVLDSKSEVRP